MQTSRLIVALPLLPGKREAWIRFTQALHGGRRREYEASRRRLGIVRERFWLQETDGTTLAMIVVESTRPGACWPWPADTEHPFDRWFRRQLRELHGLETGFFRIIRFLPAGTELIAAWTDPNHRQTSNLPDEGETQMKKLNLVRLGGILELIAVGLVVVSIALAASAGLMERTPDPAGMGQWLQDVAANQGVYVANSWSLVVNHLLEIVFFLALFQLLRKVSDTTWIAVAAGTLGLLLVSLSGIFQVGLAQLASSYAGAGSGEQAAILPAAIALERIRLATNVAGTTVAWGIGGVLFALAMLRSEIFARWLGWLGLATFALLWISALQLVWPALESAFMLAMPLMFVWLVGMSVALLRHPQADVAEQQRERTPQAATSG